MAQTKGREVKIDREKINGQFKFKNCVVAQPCPLVCADLKYQLFDTFLQRKRERVCVCFSSLVKTSLFYKTIFFVMPYLPSLVVTTTTQLFCLVSFLFCIFVSKFFEFTLTKSVTRNFFSVLNATAEQTQTVFFLFIFCKLNLSLTHRAFYYKQAYLVEN